MIINYKFKRKRDDPQTVIENEKAIEPPIPTREGYEFIRWQFNSRPFNLLFFKIHYI